MIRFNLDKKVNLDFFEQIKGQLLSAIYCGKIKEGDRLPSIRELSDALDINHKTIRRIYLHLAEEGYVEMVRGSGVFLKKRSSSDNFEHMRRRAIFKLINDVSEKAHNLGLSPERFARIYNDFATGSTQRKLKLAVVDHQEEAYIFSRELRMRLGVEVITLPLGEQPPEEGEPVGDVDYFLSTSWHLEEVRRLASHYGCETIEIKPSHQIYTEILKAAQDRDIGIIIQDERTMHASWDIFMNLYHPSTTRKFWIAPIVREDLVEKIISEADLIFVSPMCWDEVRRRTPADKELKTYENFISEHTINQIRELQLLG